LLKYCWWPAGGQTLLKIGSKWSVWVTDAGSRASKKSGLTKMGVWQMLQDMFDFSPDCQS
jgi:hypothetical protein